MAIARTTGMIGIEFDDRKVMTMFTGYQRTIPKAIDKGMKNLAGSYAMKYLEQMGRAGARPPGPRTRPFIGKWTGQTHNILKHQIKNPTRLGKNHYAVVVPASLIALDRMPVHFVAMSGRIRQWAQKKAKWALNKSSITVHPHPWIKNANRNARRFVKIHPRKEIVRALRRKGR